MGTSQSSNGSPSGVPMVPSWAAKDAPIAEKGRFGSARRSLGEFISSGDHNSMRRGVGQYIRKGYGGSRTASSRMTNTAKAAQLLNVALLGLTQNNGQLNSLLLVGKTADEIMDAIVEVVSPIDGTQDAEASRESVKEALSELLKFFPNADLLNLSDDQRNFALEKFLACEIYQRLYLDLGKAIQSKASPTIASGRLKEIKDFVREEVAAAFRAIKETVIALKANDITNIIQNTIQETFNTFEGYAE